jgi:predicted nuclease of predicted toxin-antitoxin system
VKIKTDENIARRAVELLRAGGHDVMTVREQGLAGKSDEIVSHAAATNAARW